MSKKLKEENFDLMKESWSLEDTTFSKQGFHGLCKGKDGKFHYNMLDGLKDLIGNMTNVVFQHHKKWWIEVKGSPTIYYHRIHKGIVSVDRIHTDQNELKNKIKTLLELRASGKLVFPKYPPNAFDFSILDEIIEGIDDMNKWGDYPKKFLDAYPKLDNKLKKLIGYTIERDGTKVEILFDQKN